MRKWRIEDSAELYNINGWGRKYFSINEKGHVVVTPEEGLAKVDLKELMDELQVRDTCSSALSRYSRQPYREDFEMLPKRRQGIQLHIAEFPYLSH